MFDRHVNPPIPAELRKQQEEQIAADLRAAEKSLAHYDADKAGLNKRFAAAWAEEKAKDKPGRNRIRIGNITYVWRNINGSFWALPENFSALCRPLRRIPQANLSSLLSLRELLEKNGVQLIVSIVPAMDDIAARVILPEFSRVPDFQTLALVRDLSAAGIEAIYASEEIVNNSGMYPFAFFYPADPHPADTAQEVLARLAARRLQRFHFPEEYQERSFSEVNAPSIFILHPKEKYTFHGNCDIGQYKASELYPSSLVLRGGKIFGLQPESEILCWGNSFLRTPFGYDKYPMAFPARLARRLRHPVAGILKASWGCINPGFLDLFSHPEKELTGKKVFILQMGTGHFLAQIIEWPDLFRLDAAQKQLSGKTLLEEIRVQGMTVPADVLAKAPQEQIRCWEKLTNRSDFFSKKPERLSVVKKTLTSANPGKKIGCAIQASVFFSSPAVAFSVGEERQTLHPLGFYGQQTHHWQTLYFELPAGTKTIDISAECPAGCYFAIRSVKIFQ